MRWVHERIIVLPHLENRLFRESIQQTELPQRDYVEVALFNIVFHNEAFGRVFNLFEAFVFATHFKIAVVDAEIGHRRRIHLMMDAGLIEEKVPLTFPTF